MIKIVIVDDESLVASSLGTLLGLEEDLNVLAVLHSGEQLLQWWEGATEHPDVIVSDLHMDGLDGIDTAAELAGKPGAENVRFMIVTSHPRPRALKRALANNILGFVPKTSTAQEFAQAIRTIHSGKRYLDPEVAASAISAGESPLTDREVDVLEAAGTGVSVSDIAATVHLAQGTTRNYLSSAMSKTGTQNRFEAYTVAREKGWL